MSANGWIPIRKEITELTTRLNRVVIRAKSKNLHGADELQDICNNATSDILHATITAERKAFCTERKAKADKQSEDFKTKKKKEEDDADLALYKAVERFEARQVAKRQSVIADTPRRHSVTECQ